MMTMMNIWLRMIDDLSMDAKFHDFAERDRQTEQWTDGAMDGQSNGRTEQRMDRDTGLLGCDGRIQKCRQSLPF